MQNERLAIPQSALNLPHWNGPTVARVDNVFGDRTSGLPRPRGGRAFRCRVEALEAPRRLRLRYPGDFIVGTGEWRCCWAGCCRSAKSTPSSCARCWRGWRRK